jgi:hypothetical protein
VISKLFVVTSGCYSDYHIVAIFSSREKAEEFAPAASVRGSDAAIEEFILDETGGVSLQMIYETHVDIDTGESYVGSPGPEERPVGWSGSTVFDNQFQRIARGSSAISQEHANKVAVECRQAWLRENPGVPPLPKRDLGSSFRTSEVERLPVSL